MKSLHDQFNDKVDRIGLNFKLMPPYIFAKHFFFTRITCYSIPTNCKEIFILKDLIDSQSEYLTPTSVIRIIQDIRQAIRSLQSNLIVHGCIQASSVYVIISACRKVMEIFFSFSCTTKNTTNCSLLFCQEI